MTSSSTAQHDSRPDNPSDGGGVWSRPTDEVLRELDTSEEGLSSDAAAARAQEAGPNELPTPPAPNPVMRFLSHFDDILIYILLTAAVLKAIMGEWVDAGVVFAVALVNAVIGFVQEGQALDSLDAIRSMMTARARVRRDGEWSDVDAVELVPGDVVALGPGDRVPADLRLLTSSQLRIEESALTGESVPSSKGAAPAEPDAGVGDRTSMAFSGTIVSGGQATGVVTGTGAHTEIGRIRGMVSEAGDDALDTPLTRQLARFGRILSLAILALAGFMLVIGRLVHDFPPAELISAAIGFAVAAVPEGLPAIITISLALGVQQLARRRAITRRLPSVETLGAVSTICSDKTGTLTLNEMSVREVVTAGATYEVTGMGYTPEGAVLAEGEPADLDAHPDLFALVETMAVCNDATLTRNGNGDNEGDEDSDGDGAPGPDGEWQLVGEPTEGALTVLGLKAGIDTEGYERLDVLPFDSEHKYMAVLVRTPTGSGGAHEGGTEVLVKGAPDRVLERCSQQLGADGQPEPLDRAHWEEAIDDLGAQGLRVLAAARLSRAPGGSEDLDQDSVAEGMVLLGLAGIVDPPRPEAIEAIATCHRAGIAVSMITGDHAGTARAIAREMGIIDSPDAPVLTGTEIEAMPQSRLEKKAPGVHVYARTSPEHKIRIVRALQARGQVVAMTGDGVNDAPALTRADVGVAMGIKGTEATKDAADIVLADDNFSTIELAVEEGRRIYDNIVKAVVFLLPSNGAQALVLLVAVLAGWALPLDPVQVLWINMVTAITLSVTLAYEGPEPGLMDRPPRPGRAPLLGARSLRQIAFVSVLIGAATLATFLVTRDGTGDIRVSQTVAVNTLAFAQLAYLFNCRFLHTTSLRREVVGTNRVVWISVVSLLALQVLFVHAPFMHVLFHSAPVNWLGWVLPAAVAVAVFVLVELWKWAGRARAGR